VGTKRVTRRLKDARDARRPLADRDGQPDNRAPATILDSHADILRLQGTVGNRAVQRLLATGRGALASSVQREDAGGYRWKPQPENKLKLDPEIEAQIRVIQLMQSQVQFPAVEQGLRSIDLFKLPIPAGPPASTPTPMDTTPAAAPKPIVPAGAGPEAPKAGSPGDIFSAIVAIPAVEQAVGQLKEEAQTRVKRDWSSLSGGGKFSLIAATVAIGGGALTAALANEDSRKFIFENVSGKSIPVPGVRGLTVQVNLAGEEKSVQFGLDLLQFLPDSLR
jgi:hypothetical protein